jgi:nucleoside-diphosphate-sugar epimerase
LRQVLGWVPTTSLERGLEITYRWIEGQLRAQNRLPSGPA